MTDAEDRLTIWASQLAAGDFPPVCAMTGRDAETWRKFNFGTIPVWAPLAGYAGVAGHVAMRRLEKRALGHLPLTRAANRTVALRGVWGLVVGALGMACWIAAVVIDYSGDTGSPAITLLGIFGFVAMPIAVAVVIARRRSVGPQGTVRGGNPGDRDFVVEMWNLHPAFVAATNAMYYSRTVAHSPTSK